MIQRYTFFPFRAVRKSCKLKSLLVDALMEFRPRYDFVDEPPVFGAFSLDSLFDRAEDVGQIPADLALVDEARQAAGGRQHREQRNLRE